jgi:cell division protein ZapB
MTADLLQQLEQKVAHAVEVIELLRLQVEELEQENLVLKTEHDKWRKDLSALLKRFDQIDTSFISRPAKQTVSATEEDFMTV